jgi:hypothetical protein
MNVERNELHARIKALGASLSVPVAYEGVSFTKPSIDGQDLPFIECFIRPSGTKNVTVDGLRVRDTGVFKVNVWGPSGSGTGDVDDIAQSVVSAFPIVPKTGEVSIESTPSIGGLITDVPGWLIRPVTISYRYEH